MQSKLSRSTHREDRSLGRIPVTIRLHTLLLSSIDPVVDGAIAGQCSQSSS